jgi:hypothetical protein
VANDNRGRRPIAGRAIRAIKAVITVIIAGSERFHASYLFSTDADGVTLQDRQRHQADVGRALEALTDDRPH